ncbi:hypothetical protein CAAU_2716 [Caloramator australicus RC3]|uniref:Uncharacterized protein n=1 Tax=Caloramator australicus RC3 TaxID=857293 RepID=I7J6W9_9CLOT|nr:hypothetical protein CAAU_2716 [Caloramator australicus RC3]
MWDVNLNTSYRSFSAKAVGFIWTMWDVNEIEVVEFYTL